EFLAVRALECRLERTARVGRLVVRTRGKTDDQIESLAHEAAVRQTLDRGALELEPGVREHGKRVLLESSELGLEHRDASDVEPDADGRDAIDAGGRDQKPERRRDARRWRTDDAREAQLARDAVGVHRARAAGREQRVPARIP